MKLARLIAAGVFCMAAFAGCDNSALPPGGTYQSMSGIVVDAATNAPIAGATVTVDTVLSATTDSKGAFHFDRIPVGEVDYVVTPPANSNYRPTASQTAHLAPDKPLTLTITLSQ